MLIEGVEFNEGDEAIFTIRGSFRTTIHNQKCLVIDNKESPYRDIINIASIEGIKITKRAVTKLSVGDIVDQIGNESSGWKVLHINKIDKCLCLLNIDNDICGITGQNSWDHHTKFIGLDGSEIDWEATFS